MTQVEEDSLESKLQLFEWVRVVDDSIGDLPFDPSVNMNNPIFKKLQKFK